MPKLLSLDENEIDCLGNPVTSIPIILYLIKDKITVR